jgi:hypothetical protein
VSSFTLSTRALPVAAPPVWPTDGGRTLAPSHVALQSDVRCKASEGLEGSRTGKVDGDSMAILVVPHVVEVTAHGNIGGRSWASVWGIANGPSWWAGGADVAEVARDFANNWQDHIMPALCSAVVLDGFSYLSLDSATGTTGTLTPDAAKPVSGADPTAALPPNACYLVKKHCGSARGSRSGRAYLPGVPEPGVDHVGALNASLRTNLAAWLQQFHDGLTQSPFEPGERYVAVIHRPPAARLKGPQVVQGSHSRVTELSVDPLIATQRRRLRG